MGRMTADAKERLKDAADRRKWQERDERHRAFVAATPRVLLKGHRFDERSRMTGKVIGLPDLIRAGEVRFVPTHEYESQSFDLFGSGALGPKRKRTDPDKVTMPHESHTADKVGGRLLKPLAADLRRYDAMGDRIVKMQTERREFLKSMVGRARPLTRDEIVTLGKTVTAIGETGYIRPEAAAKKVKLPR